MKVTSVLVCLFVCCLTSVANPKGDPKRADPPASASVRVSGVRLAQAATAHPLLTLQVIIPREDASRGFPGH